MSKTPVIVIGAGIIGTTSALALQEHGYAVTLLGRDDASLAASSRNAGAFAFSEVIPLATPGIMRKAPKWLLDPLGPLSVPPSYLPSIAPWLLKFWRASWTDRYEASVRAQTALMGFSREALFALMKKVSGEHFLVKKGQMQLYEGEAEFRASIPFWDIRRELGVRYDLLESPEAIAEIQPGLDRRFTHGGFTPDWVNCCDPASWLRFLKEAFVEQGGQIVQAEALSLRDRGQDVEVLTSSGAYDAAKVVVSAGAWSHRLAATLGDRIPLETERGYNTTLPEGSLDLRTHLTFSGHGFVISEIDGKIRVGGAVELGGLERAPDYRRAKILLDKARSFLPELKTDDGEQWMGFRPSIPDSLPVIDYSPQSRRVVYAFGHGHLGLTQSAGTAQLVAGLVSEQHADFDLKAFSAGRF
ncbi:NAD(P)/FAD-dependent oxidoreductase [Kiloniella sp. b19]|uniref:NAD(P)/FAD-dependent oxidoreductase n=1 Tax=Kiloniella sp. GXU_MW_B19 TaxID=3141326 RepID=UPI0031D16505